MPKRIPSYKGTEPYIFVSYSHKDSDEVMKDIAWMNESGYRVWYDEGIEFGKDFPSELAAAIKNCSQFVLYLSPNAIASAYVNREIFFALDLKKPILPIYLCDTELSDSLHLILSSINRLERYKYDWDDYCLYLDSGLYKECKAKQREEYDSLASKENTIPEQENKEAEKSPITARKRVVTNKKALLIIAACIVAIAAAIIIPNVIKSAISDSTTKKPDATKQTTAEQSADSTGGNTDTTTLKVGDTFYFGHYEQDNDLNNGKEKIAWKVLAVENSKALLISEKILDCKPYNGVLNQIDWENCTLRQWLNNEFFNNAFSINEKDEILIVNLDKNKSSAADKQEGGNVLDKVFCLSVAEASAYFANDFLRCAKPSTVAKELGMRISDENGFGGWWLRSQGNDQNRAIFINDDGSIYFYGNYVNLNNIGVRPALWINLQS